MSIFIIIKNKYIQNFFQVFYVILSPLLFQMRFAKISRISPHKARYMKYIAWIPGLKMIAIGNSTALGHATNESDIDLFIVTAPKSLWLVRILVTGIFAILGVRKTDKNHAGKMCLSFFVTLEGMNLSNFALPSDIYLYFWCIYLRPLVNYDDIYQDFLHSQTWADFSEYAEEIRTRTSEYIVYSEGGRKENIFSR